MRFFTIVYIGPKVEALENKITPKINTLKILHNEHVLILRMFTIWTLGPLNSFGYQHNFQFKLLHLFFKLGWGVQVPGWGINASQERNTWAFEPSSELHARFLNSKSFFEGMVRQNPKYTKFDI